MHIFHSCLPTPTQFTSDVGAVGSATSSSSTVIVQYRSCQWPVLKILSTCRGAYPNGHVVTPKCPGRVRRCEAKMGSRLWKKVGRCCIAMRSVFAVAGGVFWQQGLVGTCPASQPPSSQPASANPTSMTALHCTPPPDCLWLQHMID